MAEWLKARASKACIPLRVSGVRIPLSPPVLRQPFFFFESKIYQHTYFLFLVDQIVSRLFSFAQEKFKTHFAKKNPQACGFRIADDLDRTPLTSEKPTSGPCHLPRTEFTLCDSSFNVPLYASVSGTRGVAYIARCGVDSCHFVAKGGL